MTKKTSGGDLIPSIQLIAELEPLLSQHFGTPFRIEAFDRHPSAYRSSFALEEITVSSGGGITLSLIFKDTSWRALSPAARHAKPQFLHDPTREIALYRTILPDLPGTATCFGTVADDTVGRSWLFLEHVCNDRLSDLAAGPAWQAAVQWIAHLHARFADHDTMLPAPIGDHLLCYDTAYYRRWCARCAIIAPAQLASPLDRRVLARVLAHYRRTIPRLVALPTTLIHGEYYATNVLADLRADATRICPVDWEMAAIAPGLIDLAALCAGAWSADERLALARPYFDAMPADAPWQPLWRDFVVALDDCRLHLSVQWLGWSAAWSPPVDQEQDWLAVAARIIEQRATTG